MEPGIRKVSPHLVRLLNKVQTAACYAGSFITHANFIRHPSIIAAFDMMLEWLVSYCEAFATMQLQGLTKQQVLSYLSKIITILLNRNYVFSRGLFMI